MLISSVRKFYLLSAAVISQLPKHPSTPHGPSPPPPPEITGQRYTRKGSQTYLVTLLVSLHRFSSHSASSQQSNCLQNGTDTPTTPPSCHHLLSNSPHAIRRPHFRPPFASTLPSPSHSPHPRRDSHQRGPQRPHPKRPPPSHPRFQTLWAELRILQASGIKVLGMLGGAAKGSFTRLDYPSSTPDFEKYYAPLAALIKEQSLDGLDLDVEEEMTLGGIIHLIDRLRSDFGPGFIITLAPVAAALLNHQHNLSGFDYEALEVMRGREISWYNTQFYCGWGDCSNPVMYEMLLVKGWDPEKIVVGLVTNPENGGGFVPFEVLGNVIPLLAGRHPRFGGVMGWEYFNSLPGGRERPWEWAELMGGYLRGRRSVDDQGLKQAEEDVKRLREKAEQERKRGAAADSDGEDGNEVQVPVPKDFEYHSDGLLEDEDSSQLP
ncbi:uncharacterized protein QC763_209140 [Podospora pseudopauciseta]|uniref:GH18 domain-containing protein n=1 Tax=Podospora pseudopauciseta TaxID=2093780 RepID=A0ABR0HPX9_9PEZI|nr:hypothetical protein QC763_209140 [Podospora pseudopauciseta]